MEESSPNSPAPPVFQALDRHERSPYTRGEYLRRFLWAAIERTLFRWSPPRAFGWRAMLLRCLGARIGLKTRISRTCTVVHPWLFSLGDWSSIGPKVEVYNLGAVDVGAHTAISQGVYLCAGTHDHLSPHLPLVRSSIRIGDGVWVAAQAFIGPDLTIGQNALVGARAVVISDVSAGVIVAGNPARVIKARFPHDITTPVEA